MDESQKQQRIAELKAKMAQRAQQLDALESRVKDSVAGARFEPAPELPPIPQKEPGMLSTFATHVKNAAVGTLPFLGEVAKAVYRYPDQALDRAFTPPSKRAGIEFGRHGPLYSDPPKETDLTRMATETTLPVAEGAGRAVLSGVDSIASGLGFSQPGGVRAATVPSGYEVPRHMSLNEFAGLAGDVTGGILMGKAIPMIAPPVARGVASGARKVAGRVGEVFGESPLVTGDFSGLSVNRPPRMLPPAPGAAPQVGPAPIYAEASPQPTAPAAPAQLPPVMEVPRLPPSTAESLQRRPQPNTAPDVVFQADPGGAVTRMPGEVPVWADPINRLPTGEAVSTATPMPPAEPLPPPPRPATDFWREQPGTMPPIKETPPTQSRPAQFSPIEEPGNRVGVNEAIGRGGPAPELPPPGVGDRVRGYASKAAGAGKRAAQAAYRDPLGVVRSAANTRVRPGPVAAGGAGRASSNPIDDTPAPAGPKVGERDPPRPKRRNPDNVLEDAAGEQALAAGNERATPVPERGAEGAAALKESGAPGSRREAGKAREAGMEAPGSAGFQVQEGAAGRSVNPARDRGPRGANGREGRLNVNARIAPDKYGIESQVRDWVSPQYDPFIQETGLLEATATEGRRARELTRAGVDEVFGSPEILRELKEQAAANPIESQIVIKTRQGQALTPEEVAYLEKNGNNFMGEAEAFFDYLDRAREEIIPELRTQGLEIGDLGENYFPHSYPTIKHVIDALGKDWVQMLDRPEFREKILPNLEMHRVSDITPDMNWAEMGEKYIRQISEAQTLKLLGKELKGVADQWRSQNKTREATHAERYGQANGLLGSNLSEMDMTSLDNVLREIAADPKLLEKYGNEKVFGRVSSKINALNKLSSALVVGGRVKSFANSVVSNLGRTFASETMGNLRKGLDQLRKKPSPELLKEWEAQGIVDNSMRNVYESFDAKVAKWEEWYFANVRLPDQWARIVIYEARKNGLRQAHPEWTDAKIKDAASVHTAKYSDMTTEGFRSAKSNTPEGQLFLHLISSPTREFLTIVDNVRKGDYAAVAKQTGVKVAGVTALVMAFGSGDPKDAAKGLVEMVPVLGSAITHGNGVGAGAIGVVGERAGRALSGNVAGAMPGSIQQFYPEDN